MATTVRHRSKRLEVRTTIEERDLIDRAVEASNTDLTTFVMANLADAARRVLADREQFALSVEAQHEWDKINRRPAREVAGLRALMERPSPFVE